mmetsp:Transcript_38137/g.77977  ORF Transcript_38137/g.77977 Transcript_38137/m.77977 type:complete len:93 (+) Transcript_38137:109-387(+)
MAGVPILGLNPSKKFPEFDGYAVFMNEQLEGTMDEDCLTSRLRAKWDTFTERQKKAYQERVPGGPVVRVRLNPGAFFNAKRQRTEVVNQPAT